MQDPPPRRQSLTVVSREDLNFEFACNIYTLCSAFYQIESNLIQLLGFGIGIRLREY